MDVIFSYLDSMFAPYPSTPKLEEAKTELRGMMEDAYNGLITEGYSQNEAVGKVITEFGNLDELAPVLGISSEIFTAPGGGVSGGSGASGAVSNAGTQSEQLYPTVTLEDAHGFAESRRTTQFSLAIAVALFVLSPISLFASVLINGQDNPATALGLIPLLALVAVGVILIVGVDQKRAAYRHLGNYQFSANPVVSNWAKELDRKHHRSRTVSLQIAVALWILSATPVLFMSLAFPNFGGENKGAVFGIILTLVFVAAGLLVFLPSNWANEVYDTLSKQRGAVGEYVPGSEENNLVGVISGFYWPLLVAIYLAWSFISNDWSISWVIWPIGAAIFVVFAAGFGALEQYRRARR